MEVERMTDKTRKMVGEHVNRDVSWEGGLRCNQVYPAFTKGIKGSESQRQSALICTKLQKQGKANW